MIPILFLLGCAAIVFVSFLIVLAVAVTVSYINQKIDDEEANE